MEELGIGRPSTYAPTISTIQARNYVEKSDSEGFERKVQNIVLKNNAISKEETGENTGAEKNKLFPTHLAEITTDFLKEYFTEIVDYDFTANAEKDLDKIADGEKVWQDVISEFYKNFAPLVEKSADVSRAETSKAREIGPDPKTGKMIYARYGKYGPMLQKGETESEEKPAFAPMPDGVTIKNITLEQALEMFKLPRTVGETEDGKLIKANIGRFGPYIQVDKLYVSIKPHDPMTITHEEALEFYNKKLEQEANKYISQFDSGISVVNGPYGPYVTDGKKNARISKTVDPKTIDEAMAKEMLDKAPVRKKRVVRRKK
jgi:DNA topoisomerase-1